MNQEEIDELYTLLAEWEGWTGIFKFTHLLGYDPNPIYDKDCVCKSKLPDYCYDIRATEKLLTKAIEEGMYPLLGYVNEQYRPLLNIESGWMFILKDSTYEGVGPTIPMVVADTIGRYLKDKKIIDK
jgi:hypothetical protein